MRLKVWAARNETQFQMKVVAKMRLNFKIGVARKEAWGSVASDEARVCAARNGLKACRARNGA